MLRLNNRLIALINVNSSEWPSQLKQLQWNCRRAAAFSHRKHSSTYVSTKLSYAFGRCNDHMEYTTIGDALDERAKQNPTGAAVISRHEGLVKTFGDLNADVNKLCASMTDKLGLKHGDRIGIWAPNSYRWILVQYAAARLGLLTCTINPVYKENELRYALVKGKVRTLFLPGYKSPQNIVNKFVDIFNSMSNSMDDLSINNVVVMDGQTAEVCKHVAPVPSLGVHNLDQLLLNDGYFNEELLSIVKPDDPAIVMFTSGTTGNPKGAVLSHFNLVNNAASTARRLDLVPSAEFKACIPVPLFHIFGLVYGSVMMSKIGMPIVLTGYRYNVDSVCEAIREENCTHVMMVPAMTVDVANHVEKSGVNLPSLKNVITGSAPTPVEVAKKLLKTVPSVKKFYIRYGSTETGGCMTMPHPTDDPSRTIDNVGVPLDFVEAKLIEPKTKKMVKLGEQGEILVRGPNVMIGYLDDEAKTREAIDESRWFSTGDMATMSADGYLKLVGRTKEMIIRGGENIYPKEIEELIHHHEHILEAFACGVPDPRLGEEICLWVKLKDSANKVTESDIKEFFKDKVARYKVPRYILFVEDFPRTPKGSPQRFAMREKSCQLLNLKEN